jgi:hypothetical protein
MGNKKRAKPSYVPLVVTSLVISDAIKLTKTAIQD